LISVIKYSR